MEEFTEKKFIRDSLLSTDYKFFVHIKRGKGIGSVRKQDTLVFPNICAMCGSEDVDKTIGIGRSQLYLFTNVGYVPYCREHYRLVSAVQENYVFTSLSVLGIGIVTCIVGILIFGLNSIRDTEGILYLVTFPSFVLIRYLANRRFRSRIGWDEEEERLLLPFSATYYISLVFALVVAVIGYLTRTLGLYVLSVLISIFGLGYDQAQRTTEIDKFIESNKILRLGAAQIPIVRPKFYTLGFVNIDFYRKFIELNPELIISSISSNMLLQKRNILEG